MGRVSVLGSGVAQERWTGVPWGRVKAFQWAGVSASVQDIHLVGSWARKSVVSSDPLWVVKTGWALVSKLAAEEESPSDARWGVPLAVKRVSLWAVGAVHGSENAWVVEMVSG